MKLSDLSSIRQRTGESVQDYIQRFRDVRRRCYSLNITDAQLADLAFQGLIGPIKDRFAAQDFTSLAHLVQKISAHEARFQDNKKERFQRVSYAEDSEEEEVDMAEWTRVKKSVSCPYGTGEKEVKCAFDVTKADLIFDLLLKEKQIQLSANHVIPPASEIMGKKYCKWHNTFSHHTNECVDGS